MDINKVLKQDDRVSFKIGGLSGNGKIVGVANNPLPIIGATYIIEPDVPIMAEGVYNYSHFVCPIIYLTQIED